jgi:hypothetical protein
VIPALVWSRRSKIHHLLLSGAAEQVLVDGCGYWRRERQANT